MNEVCILVVKLVMCGGTEGQCGVIDTRVYRAVIEVLRFNTRKYSYVHIQDNCVLYLIY